MKDEGQAGARLVTTDRGSAIAWKAPAAVRAVTMGGKALLILALALWFSPAELGLYGLISATISLTTYAYGLDYYTFTLREISISEPAAARRRLRDQFILFGSIYVLGAPALVWILAQYGIDPTLSLLVVLLAAMQHATLEFYRLLVRMGQALAATVGLFLRDAAWIPACLLLWLWDGELTVAGLLVCWLGGSVISATYAFRQLARDFPGAAAAPIDWAWLGRGLRTGLQMIPGTLSLRGLFTVDRMIVAAIAPPEVLGAYVFFSASCASAQGLFETAVLPHYWPPLLEAARRGDSRAAYHAQRTLARACQIGALVSGAAMLVGGTALAMLLPNPVYRENGELLFFLAAAYSLLTIANIPHYRLYAAHRDRQIIAVNIAAFAVFLATAGAASFIRPEMAVPVALVMGCMTLVGGKQAMAGPARKLHG